MKMARKKGSRKRAIGERTEVSLPGSCEPNLCKGDLGCKNLDHGHHACVCTHDSAPPFANGTCPRRVVGNGLADVDESAGRIPVQLPAPVTVNTEEIHPDYPKVQNYVVPSILILIICFCASIYLIIFVKKRLKRRETRESPMNLKQSFLVAERYAPNPQYSACSASGVPILKKETLSFLKEVGEGCFGKVFKGELLSEDGDQVCVVAIKVLKDTANKEAEEDFLREVEIMSAFRHPNILSLLGVILKDETVNPMMVFEFMPHGDLAELLRSQQRSIGRGALQEAVVPQLARWDLFSVALQIAGGMKYLASQRFVHRDLACRNCLVAEGPVVKIADFGMSRDVYTCDYYKIGGSRLLPVRWMSPESVVYGRFTLESDIWSYGVVLWEIFSFGKQPYYGHTNEEVVKLILDGIMLIPPRDCPALICDLMKNCWKTEPRHRIIFPNICEKLEIAYENEKQTSLVYESENKKMRPGGNKSLPRPPPLPVIPQMDLVDGEGYLKPNEINDPVSYLETLCDAICD